MKDPTAIIIGDSTHNTLGLIRSLGRAGIRQHLILKCGEDNCFVAKSRYLKDTDVFRISDMDEALAILDILKDEPGEGKVLMCTFDEAAEFVDANETVLSEHFITPCRGSRIGTLFNKDAQCRLAKECGLTVPESVVFRRKDDKSKIRIAFPLIIKPLTSTKGEKSDIHIIHDDSEFDKALSEESGCDEFLLQEYITKEYELDCIGISTENGAELPGAIRKIRHYPDGTGAGAYGIFVPASKLGINLDGLNRFLAESRYHGPFSVEFLHSRGKNYFMEVNFRNDGLAYVATAAGANIHARYVNPGLTYNPSKVKSIRMMNYSIDPLHIKEGRITRRQWLRDLLRTRVFINASLRDFAPTYCYYIRKLSNKMTNKSPLKSGEFTNP